IVIDIRALVLIYGRRFCCASINTFLIIRKDLSLDVEGGNGLYLPLLEDFLRVREHNLCYLPYLWYCNEVWVDIFLYLPLLEDFLRVREHNICYLLYLEYSYKVRLDIFLSWRRV